MTSEDKKLVPPPVVSSSPALPDEDEWELDDGDRETRSVPAIILAEIYGRAPSRPPPSGPPTDGLESMLITPAMLGKVVAPEPPPAQPRIQTETVKMAPLQPRTPEKK